MVEYRLVRDDVNANWILWGGSSQVGIGLCYSLKEALTAFTEHVGRIERHNPQYRFTLAIGF